MKSVMIIDDEKDSRDLLCQYLKDFPAFSVIGQAENGVEAVRRINHLKPDLIFLDIQMPGLNGFEVLTQLEELPQIIFSTAYDNYALKAFEFHALDYLLKPYGQKRFEKAISRLTLMDDQLISLTESILKEAQTYPNKVILHKGNKRLLVNTADIYHIDAFGDYSKVFLQNAPPLLSTSGISTLQEKLDPTIFKRVHRSHLVNLHHASEWLKIDRYHYLLLRNGTKIKISESYLPEIKKLMV